MPPEPITVHVNRSARGAVEVEPTAIETDRSFELRLRNHGAPAHVHCRLTEGLADAASVEEPNWYVEAEEEVVVPVRVSAHDGSVTGSVELSTRFGANSAAADVTLSGSEGERNPVDVDDRLSNPRRSDPDEGPPGATLGPPALRPGTVGLWGLAGVALLAALAAALVVGGTAGVVGFGVVLAGILAAITLLRR